MTKMPDKIGPICYDCGLEKGCSYTLEPLSGNCAVCGRINMFNDRVVDNDLIPQPVTQPTPLAQEPVSGLTDEAKQRGLIDLIDLNMEHDETSSHDFNRACAAYLGDHHDTIKAALSQPVPVFAKSLSDEELKAVKEGLKAGEIRLIDNITSQPEAIQKAVEALERMPVFVTGDGVWLNLRPKARENKGGAMWKIEGLEAEALKGFKIETENALEGLRTHQSELEALKAENAHLRRAVVDLASPECLSSCVGTSLSLSAACIKHAATIAKAKGDGA